MFNSPLCPAASIDPGVGRSFQEIFSNYRQMHARMAGSWTRPGEFKQMPGASQRIVLLADSPATQKSDIFVLIVCRGPTKVGERGQQCPKLTVIELQSQEHPMAALMENTDLFDLAELDYLPSGIVSRVMLKQPTGSVTAFAFGAGQGLSEHTCPYDALLHVTEGESIITIGGTSHRVEAGQMIKLPANVPHAVTADEPFKMLLTMLRSEKK
jgi:quercetin dioxygenase-like cupin family protein